MNFLKGIKTRFVQQAGLRDQNKAINQGFFFCFLQGLGERGVGGGGGGGGERRERETDRPDTSVVSLDRHRQTLRETF